MLIGRQCFHIFEKDWYSFSFCRGSQTNKQTNEKDCDIYQEEDPCCWYDKFAGGRCDTVEAMKSCLCL